MTIVPRFSHPVGGRIVCLLALPLAIVVFAGIAAWYMVVRHVVIDVVVPE